jgi:hypothetical protein
LYIDLIFFLYELLLNDVVAFKNPAFEQEQEWRLVATVRSFERRHDRQHGHQEHQDTQKPSLVRYRPHRGMVVPFICLEPVENELLPIRSVRYGPSLDKHKTEHGLMMFLSEFRHKDVKVFGSDMPVIL